jgi:hypothetical protein
VAGTPEALRKPRHDLANPLAPLLSETQPLLLNGVHLDPDTARGLRGIEALGRRMRDILAASRDPG